MDGENDAAIITCSSGTTGRSKGDLLYCGCVVTRENLLTNWFCSFKHQKQLDICHSHAMLVDRIIRFEAFYSNDVVLKFSRLHWISCTIFLVRATLIGAVRLITMQPPTAALQLRLIEQHKVTFVHNSPELSFQLYRSELLATADLSSVRKYVTGDAKIPQVLVDHIDKHLPNGTAHVSYGLSEVAGIVSLDYPDAHGRGTVGRLLSGFTAKIIDGNGNRCGVNEKSELRLKQSYRILGYFEDPQATHDLIDAEGYLATGDIGYIDKDGYLYIVDRKKDMLRYGDQTVYPSFIENHLMTSELIEAVCAVGIPDELSRDCVAVAIIPKANATIDENMVHAMIDGEAIGLMFEHLQKKLLRLIQLFCLLLFRSGTG